MGARGAIHIRVTRQVAAPADRTYGILADYRTGHPRILPPAFRDLTVEEGGRGAGTVIRFGMKSFGTVRWVRAHVTEPGPGLVLVERTLDDPPLETTFTVEPLGPATCRVSIETTWTPVGLRGLVERLLAPPMLRRLYADELRRLDAVARQSAGDG